jgi:hypothetical protein
MNIKNYKRFKRRMSFLEKLQIGWRHVLDNRWEWWYHLTEGPEEMNWDFWYMLNMDMVKYEQELYYL